MKNLVSFLLLSLFSGQLALAACPGTVMSTAAKKLHFSEKALVEIRKLDEELVHSHLDISKQHPEESEAYKYMQKLAAKLNRNLF